MPELRRTDTQKWKQPSGLDIADYKGHEKWGNLRWAWEFLRRNPKFQSACREAKTKGLNKKERRALAQEFHLGQYKPYWQRFKSAKKGYNPPKFVTRNLRFWTCLDGVTKPPRTVRVKLQDGEVLVRLPVWAAAKLTRSSLPTLIKSTKALSNALLKELLQRDKLDKAKDVRDRIDGGFLRYLRVLDLESYCESLGKTECAIQQLEHLADRYLALFGSEAEKKMRLLQGGADEFSSKYQDLKDRAPEWANTNYLHIAALNPKFPKSLGSKIVK